MDLMEMWMLRRVLVVGVIGLVVGSAWGAETTSGPASAPATTAAPAGATVKRDYSDPKKALASFLGAAVEGDRAGMEQGLIIEEGQREGMKTILDLMQATGALRKAAVERFGTSAEKTFGAKDEMEQRLKRLDAVVIKVAGDSALANFSGNDGTRTVVLKRVSNQWRIDAGTLFGFTEKGFGDQAVALSTKMLPITQRVAKEIGEGKFVGPEEAYEEYWTLATEAAKGVVGK